MRPLDDQAAGPHLAARHCGGVIMEDTVLSRTRPLNYGLATFLVTLSTMIPLYKWLI